MMGGYCEVTFMDRHGRIKKTVFAYFLTSEYDIKCKRNAAFENSELGHSILIFDPTD